jgi:hypothetical protein
MVADLVEQGQIGFQASWVARETTAKIEEACASLGLKRLRTLKDALPPEITFEEIKLVIAHMRFQQSREQNGAPAHQDR